MPHPDTHIAIFGHAKHGKSTVAGRLLHEFGAIDERQLEQLTERAQQKGKDYNAYNLAYLERRPTTYAKEMNRQDDESRTVVPERGNVRLSSGRMLSIIDTPGYSRFLNNIIYGAHLSDLALLVVEASSGVEAGTLNVARILRSFAIPVVGIFVTKMDVVDYSEARFRDLCEQIEKDLLGELDHCPAPPIVPVSALAGDGVRTAGQMAWYRGPKLVEVVEQAKASAVPMLDDSLHFVVEGSKEVHSLPGIGTVIVGTLESGVLRRTDRLLLEPASTQRGEAVEFPIKSMQYARSITERRTNETVDEVAARAIVSVALPDLNVRMAGDLFKRGAVFGTAKRRPTVAELIEAEVFFFEPDTVYEGKEYVFYTNASQSVAHITRLPQMEGSAPFLHTRSTKMRDTVLAFQTGEADSIRTTIRLKFPVCIEADPAFQRLTRFILKHNNNIVACGRCLAIL